MTVLFNVLSCVFSISWILISLSLIAGWLRLPLAERNLIGASVKNNSTGSTNSISSASLISSASSTSSTGSISSIDSISSARLTSSARSISSTSSTNLEIADNHAEHLAELVAEQLSFSILIAARNEEQTIANCLNDILSQNYPRHLIEVIVVDDHSSDKTSEVVLSFNKENVRLIRLNESKLLNSYKKKAITEAIGQARGKLIITTDADCRMGKSWIRSIAGAFSAGDVRMVSSPVVYFGEETQFQKIQSLEFMYLIGMGAACISNGIPFTCNGANLAYEKEAFYAVGGFTGIDHLASGDDEFLLHKISRAYSGQVRFLKSPEAVVFTLPKENLRTFFQQRKRWASKSLKYKTKLPIIFALVLGLFYGDMILNLFLGIVNNHFLYVAGIQFIIKLFLDLIFLLGMTRFFKRSEILIYILPLELIHIFYWIFIGIAGNSGKYEWKDRMVN